MSPSSHAGNGTEVPAPRRPERRSRLLAGLLGVTLGAFGAHRFYLGYPRLAVTQLVLTLLTAGLAGLWGITEGLLILAGVFVTDARGHGLTHQQSVHWLTAAGCSLAVHAGTIVLIQQSSVILLPQPSGVNSIELTASLESAAASPDPNVEPVQIVDAAVASANSPSQSLPKSRQESPTPSFEEPADKVDLPRTVPLHSVGRRVPPPLDGETLRSRGPSVMRKTGASAGDALPTIPPAKRPPTTRRSAAQVQPTTSVTVATPSPRQDASREQSGVKSDALPQRVAYPRPLYPPTLKARGVTGLVKLRVRVGTDGRVAKASVYRSSGHPEFDRAALDVIGRWRFRPARMAGIAVEKEIAVPIRFRLEDP